MSGFKVVVVVSTFATGTLAGTVGSVTATQAEVCSSQYLIVHGDTLLDIAYEQLGTIFAAPLLMESNPDVIDDPDLIYAGDRLIVPCERAVGNAIDWSLTPDVKTLAKLLAKDQVQVIDIRESEQVSNGVIPGAVHLPYSTFEAFGDPTTTRPSAEDLSEIIGLSGIRLAEPIVIVGNKPTVADLERSAAIFGLLRDVGAPHVAILNDGFKGWVTADMPVVALPALLDPYDARVQYGDLIPAEKHAMLEFVAKERPSSFWADVIPEPDKPEFTFSEIIFAKFLGD